ncbi:MAG: DUF4163 domain-containing protein [Hungatella sp.]|nr:DUF4163 domain-containing protein [Hungatella sp.]
MKRKFSILLLLAGSILLLNGCKKKHEEVDLSSIHTTAARETMAPTTAQEEETTTEEEETTKASDDAGQISSQTLSYHPQDNVNITIAYPEISNMNDSGKQEQVNQLLKENASSLYTSMEADGNLESMDIKCRVESLDRNRATVVYTGSYKLKDGAYPVSVFFTNTVDLQQVKSLGINDYSDAYTMAGYLMSDDVEFYQVNSELKNALLEYRATQTLEDYTNLFNQADFPLKSSDGTADFPQSFSYLNQSTLYFSIPVPHALGDYAIVSFPMDGK